jgi:ATP-binding cassette, subfamily B, bacterial
VSVQVSERRPGRDRLGAGDTGDDVARVPLRRVLGLFRPHRVPMTLLMLVVLGQAAFGVTSPLLLRQIIDRAIPERNALLLSVLAAGMIAATLASGGLSVLSARLATTIGQRVMHEMRVRVYAHLQRMSLAFFTRTRSGELQSRIANDIGGINDVLTNTASSVVRSTATAVAVTVALVVMDWRLAVLALLIVPIYLLVALRIGRKRRQLTYGRQRELGKLSSFVDESLSVSGVLLVKTMGRRGEMLRRYTEQSKQISDIAVDTAMTGRWVLSARAASLTIVPALVCWLAGMRMIHSAQALSIGTVVAFASMLNRLVGPITTLQGVGMSVSTSMALFTRIFDVLDLVPEGDDEQATGRLTVRGGEVRLTGVSFRYPGEAPDDDGESGWALRDIDLVVPAGSTTALVGASGAGKTTLAYLVARLYEPVDGAVSIDGVDVRGVGRESLAETVGLVSQDTYLFHDTVRENLRFARSDATDEDIEAAARAAYVHELIAGLPEGYDTVVGESGYRFSGGERQRLAIARMLLRDPAVLVLDEATSALDNHTERLVQRALAELTRGRTTIAIAHRLSTIEHADQIVVLDAGRIVERGTHAELLARDARYAALVRAATTGEGAPHDAMVG